MSRARRMTPMQLAAAIRRERDGRVDTTAMTDQERDEAGLMTLGQAARQEHLASVPRFTVGDRVRALDPGDPWASDDPEDRAGGLMWDAWFKAGHGGCAGWSWSLLDDGIACVCGAVIPLPEGLAA